MNCTTTNTTVPIEPMYYRQIIIRNSNLYTKLCNARQIDYKRDTPPSLIIESPIFVLSKERLSDSGQSIDLEQS